MNPLRYCDVAIGQFGSDGGPVFQLFSGCGEYRVNYSMPLAAVRIGPHTKLELIDQSGQVVPLTNNNAETLTTGTVNIANMNNINKIVITSLIPAVEGFNNVTKFWILIIILILLVILLFNW